MRPLIKVPANFGKEHINSPVHGNLLLKLREGQEIKTNSMIMSLNSPVIDNLTTNLFQSTLEMDDFANAAVDCFVEAMYTGEVDKLEKGIFEDVNKMAHVFDVSWLTKRCQKFYKSDVLKFENNSYEEILFACEIASRAYYNFKQRFYVRCFVKNATLNGIGKSIFLQRYLAGFATIPTRKIEMALAIATDELSIISNCLISYISLHLECKQVDENSLFMLQKLNIQKFSRDFPSQFSELTNFLVSVSKESQSAELKELLERYVKVKSDDEASISTEEIENDEARDHSEESGCDESRDYSEESDFDEDCKDAAIQTEERKSCWVKPGAQKVFPLSVQEPVQFITTNNVTEGKIAVNYTLSGEGRSDKRDLAMRCEDVDKWSFIVEGCTVGNWNKQFLSNVPDDAVKHWVITKSSTHLNVLCNKITVLNFNFATDFSFHGFETGYQIWSRRCTDLKLILHGYPDCLLVLDNKG